MTTPKNFDGPDELSADRDQRIFDLANEEKTGKEIGESMVRLLDAARARKAKKAAEEEENRRREDAAKFLFEDYPGGKPDAGAS
jgi:hypothetical protein